MSEVKRFLADGQRGPLVVLASDYDPLAARLERADRALLIERGKLEKADELAHKLQARVAELSAFARGILDLCPHTECEGIQELAVNQGVLVEVTATEPCGDECACAEVSDFPQACYRLAADLQQPAADGDKP
jgi:hypothetical protein